MAEQPEWASMSLGAVNTAGADLVIHVNYTSKKVAVVLKYDHGGEPQEHSGDRDATIATGAVEEVYHVSPASAPSGGVESGLPPSIQRAQARDKPPIPRTPTSSFRNGLPNGAQQWTPSPSARLVPRKRLGEASPERALSTLTRARVENPIKWFSRKINRQRASTDWYQYMGKNESAVPPPRSALPEPAPKTGMLYMHLPRGEEGTTPKLWMWRESKDGGGWDPVARGARHPTLKDYILDIRYGTKPAPQWVLPRSVSIRLTKEASVRRDGSVEHADGDFGVEGEQFEEDTMDEVALEGEQEQE